jgi:hypothetical protein
MSELWRKLEPWITAGRESRKVELKGKIDLGARPNATKLAQLVSAIANTPGGTGYIVLGVMDRKARDGAGGANVTCGFEHEPDSFERRLQQVLAEATNPVPPVRLEVLDAPGIDRRIGVIVVEPSPDRPHELIRSTDGVDRGFYIRRGAETFAATREELKRMFDAQASIAIIINFAHPITPEQREQIRAATGIHVVEVVDVPAHCDNVLLFSDEIRRIVDDAGLTGEEWQTLDLILNPPGYAYAAAAIIAEVHGRAGHFPTILRLRPSAANAAAFEFAELIDLQQVRNNARERR